MNTLIVINDPDIDEATFTKVVKYKENIVSEEDNSISICDLTSESSPVKFKNWLKKTKKKGKIETIDMFSMDDPYWLVFVIGTTHDLPDFKKSGMIVKYNKKAKRKEER